MDISLLEEFILNQQVDEFINYFSQFDQIYNEENQFKLMNSIVEQSSELSDSDLEKIINVCIEHNLIQLDDKSINKLYNECLENGSTKMQNYLYIIYKDYFIKQLIENAINQGQEDILSTIPENILNNYKNNEINQELIDRLFQFSSLEDIVKLNDILNFTIDKSTFLETIKRGELNIVQYILKQKSPKFFSQFIDEAIKLAESLEFYDIVLYLQKIDKNKALKRATQIVRQIDIDEFLENDDQLEEPINYELQSKPAIVSYGGAAMNNTKTNLNNTNNNNLNNNTNTNTNLNNTSSGRVKVTMDTPRQSKAGIYRTTVQENKPSTIVVGNDDDVPRRSVVRRMEINKM